MRFPFSLGLACVAMVILSVSSPSAAQQIAQSKAIALIDDFEDGDLVGWTAPTGPCTAVNSSATGANGSARSLKIDGACGHSQGANYDLGSWQATGVTFWVRTETANVTNAYVVLGDENAAVDGGAVLFVASAGGYWSLSTPVYSYTLAPYNPGQWYRVDLTLDWVGRTVDASIDGVPRQYNVPFRSSNLTTLTRFNFYNYYALSSYLDEITMSSPPATLDIHSDGFESADGTGWSMLTPVLPDRLVIFDGGGVTGAIGGRSGADVLCGQAAQSTPGVPLAAKTRALISVSADDEIRDFPVAFGVPTDRMITGPNWQVIADDWADLLDGSIDQSLDAAGAQTATGFWYTGSLDDGSVATTTCSGWTHGSALFGGRYGSTQSTSGSWMSISNATCGTSSYHVLCLAWR